MSRRFQWSSARHFALLALAGLCAAPGCDGSPDQPGDVTPENDCPASLNTSPEGAAYTPPEDPASPVTASFKVTVDPKDPAFASQYREPQAAPLKFETVSGDLQIRGGVKSFVKHPERLYLEIYLVNPTKTGIRDAKVTVSSVTGSSTFYDFNTDPWAAPTTEMTMPAGGVAPEGVERIAIGFDVAADQGPISFQLDVAGTTTSRTAVSSSPIVVTPDGKEVWAVQADSGVVAVIDTATDTRVAQVKTGGRPSSVAVTPDSKLVLVACAECNNVTIIDREKRAVTQVFTEKDGVGRDPRNVLVSPDGSRAYVSAQVGDSVTAFERNAGGFRVLESIPVGRRPVGLSVTPDGSTLYAAHFMPRGKVRDNEGWVSAIDTSTLEPLEDVHVRDDGNVKEAECIRLIPGFDAWTAEDLSFEATPTQLGGVFLEPGGSHGWIPGLRIAPFPIFEGDVTNIGFDFIALGANSPAAMFPLETRDPRAAHLKRLGSVIDIEDREEDFLKCMQVYEETEAAVSFPVKDNPDELQNAGSVLPSIASPLSETGIIRFVGFTRGGRRSLALSYAADEIMVTDTATRSPTTVKHFMLSGSNPIGIAVTPDGTKGYVAYESSMFASVLDLSAYADPLPAPETVPYRFDYSAAAGQAGGIITFAAIVRNIKDVPERPAMTEIGQVPLVDKDEMDPVLRRGKILFSSSNPDKYPTLSGNREATCTACHPNGGNDGSVWATMEGERRTIGMWGGTAGRGWLHASATHQDVTAFATTIVKERLGGKGLSDEDVHALSEYVARGVPQVQRPAVDDALAAKGKAIFEQRCQACHAGDHLTSGNLDPNNPYGGGKAEGPVLYDVGSATDWAFAAFGEPFSNLFPSEPKQILSLLRGDRALGQGDPIQEKLSFDPRPDRKRGQLKAPSLVNTWENVLFFHDGRADSLEEAVRDISKRTGEELKGDDLAAVVEYCKSL